MTASQILEKYFKGERKFYYIILDHEDNLKEANFQNANLQGVTFLGADLKDTNLQWADLRGAKLQWAKLQGANLQWANLQGANLQWAKLQWAELQGADFERAILYKQKLPGVNLKGAILKGSDLREADLRRADLRGADLQDAQLEWANLQGAFYDKTTQFPSTFIPHLWGMCEVSLNPHSSLKLEEDLIRQRNQLATQRPIFKKKQKNLTKSQSNSIENNLSRQENPQKINRKTTESRLFNKSLEDFQENLQAEIKEPVSETNAQTSSQAFDLNKQESLETETAKVYSQIDNLISTIIDEKLDQEIIQNTPVDNQSEESQNFTEPESIHTQISAEQSVSSLSQSNLEQEENREPIYQQEAQFDPEEVRELNEEEKQQEIEGLYIAKSEPEERKKIPVPMLPRPDQPQFRQALLKAYNSCCAITGCDAEKALEAAHIIPYREQEDNHPSNGLLLRADIHRLFDENLIAIDPETMTIYLAPSLRETSYKELHGKELRQPKDPADSPKLEALQWRYEQCE